MLALIGMYVQALHLCAGMHMLKLGTYILETSDRKEFPGSKVHTISNKAASVLCAARFAVVSFHPSNPFLDLSLGYIYHLGPTACCTVKTEPLIDPTLIELLTN